MDAVAAKLVMENLANPTSFPVAQHEIIWARCRRPHERTPWPKPGDRVGYRHDRGGPVTEAEVEQVDTSNRGDYNVWRFVLDGRGYPVEVRGEKVMEMVDDPWPDVYLRTQWGRIVTRESRIAGMPGWLPLGKV